MIKIDYIKEALNFVESEEMREFLRNKLLTGNDPALNHRYCCDLIVGSRAGIDKKLSALRKLPPHKEVTDLINAAEIALVERDSAAGDVFLVTQREWWANRHVQHPSSWSDIRVPCLTFEAVLSLIDEENDPGELSQEELEEYGITIEPRMEQEWHVAEQFTSDENGKLKRKITWTLNAKGEAMFFELHDDEYVDSDRLTRVKWQGCGNNLTYLPFLFDFGDIITIDMRPFHEKYHAVIVKLGDKSDWRDVSCLYADEKGYFHCSTFKNIHSYLGKISLLYRAERFAGVLPENELMLKTISEAIKKESSTINTLENGVAWHSHKIADQFNSYICAKGPLEEEEPSYGRRSWTDFKERFHEVLFTFQKRDGIDVLSFEKMEMQPDASKKILDYAKGMIIARVFINGCSYVEILAPLLAKVASQIPYGHNINGYIYEFTDSLYEEFVNLLDNTTQNNIIQLIFRWRVYDAQIPTWVKVEKKEDCVVWSCHCEYNEYFSKTELPVFRFDIKQYIEALEELRTLAEIGEYIAVKKAAEIEYDCLPSTDESAELPPELEISGFKFKPRANKLAVVGYAGDDTEVIIPATVASPDGGILFEVDTIGRKAFKYCKTLTSITVPNSIAFIGEDAFAGCESLVSVALQEGIKYIGYDAFSCCESLKEIAIPDSVTEICNGAFYKCSSLTSVAIPGSVTSIGECTFSGCKSLTSITIPDSVIYIGDSAFANCESLTSITLPESVTKIGAGAFERIDSLSQETREKIAKINPLALS